MPKCHIKWHIMQFRSSSLNCGSSSIIPSRRAQADTTILGDELCYKIILNLTVCVVMQWMDAHPTFLENILYIGGDSYSGMPVPMLAQTIIDGTHF